MDFISSAFLLIQKRQTNLKKLALLCLVILQTTAYAQLDKIETKEMELVTYDFGHKYILAHAGRCFHNALAFHEKLFDYKPSQKVYVLIQDFGDFGNAGATAVPNNAISMGLSPFSYAFETSPAGERIFTMMNHELVHVVSLDGATPMDRFFRGLFIGKVDPSPDDPVSMVYSYLTNPRRYAPRWYQEGIASYVETWMSGGLGLALGSYDEMVFRTRSLENARIYSAQGLEAEGVTSDFQGRTNSYLYGTRFMGYLAYTYSPEKVIDWVKRDKGSRPFFVTQFKHVFGLKITRAWDHWIAFERQFQKNNLDTLRQYPVTAMTPITKGAIGSVSYPQYDRKRHIMYAAVNNPGKVPHLAALNLDTKKITSLTDIKGAALFYVSSLTYDPEGDVLYYTTDNESWRDLNAYDIKTKKATLLQKDVRTGDLAFNKTDKSIWGIKHLNGFSTIVRIPRTGDAKHPEKLYSTWQQVYTLPYGQDIFDIDVSPDGTLLSAAVTDLNGSQSILFYHIEDLLKANFTADTIINLAVASPQSFRFTDDGKYLYGSSFYTGVSNIFRIEVATKNIVAMSNSITGLFRPLEIDSNTLFAFNFTSTGFQPVYIPNQQVHNVANIKFLGNITIEKHPELKDWQIPIARASDLDMKTLITEEGKYKAGKEMKVNSAYPIVVGYKHNVGIGYKMNIADPFNFKKLNFSVAYTPRNWDNGLLGSFNPELDSLEDIELYHAAFEFQTGKFTFDGGLNEANFFDLFGPSQGSRKGLRLGIAYDKGLLFDPPRSLDLHVGVSGFYGLDQSPEFQQIVVSGFDKNFFLNLTTSLSYSSISGSLGAVDGEKGVRAMIWSSLAMSAGIVYPRLIGTLDYGIQLPGKHFSLWLRSAAGSSFSDTYNPFTRYGFAAFGNNYIDNQATRQYRSPFAFAGLGYNEDRSLIAQRFAKGTAEFVLPALHFRKLGGFNFFANWIQPTVFSSFLYSTTPDAEFAPYLYQTNKMVDLGAQVDLRMVTFSLLPSTLSFGYAKAWDIDHTGTFDEWMISLKLLH
jgi:hypothetical protein